MHSDQYPYRELHDEMLHERGPCEFEQLASWLLQYPGELEWLQALGTRSHEAAVSQEELWRLYGLSRVLEVLLLSFQEGKADESEWSGPGFSVQEFVQFAEALGLTVVIPRHFTPFDCEIVSAKNVESGERSIVLEHVHWPCLMLGRLLIARAGVSISGSRESFSGAIASSSTLYWAYRRKTRPYRDLSHGWGSNSQWRTSFRRDYRVGGKLYFNVDGDRDLTASVDTRDDEDALTRGERVELLTNRCFIRTEKASDDLWPFDDTLQMEEAELSRSLHGFGLSR